MLSESPHWFAITVKARYEKAVAHALRAKNLEEFLPVYKARRNWSDRVQAVEMPLFAGYVFCHFAYADRIAVLSTPGVMSILGAGRVYSPIPDSEIENLRIVVNSGLRMRPWPYIAPGQTVTVDSGPLAGIQGTLLRNKGETCVVVTINLLQRSVAAELERNAVRPDLLPVGMPAGSSCSV